MKVWGGALGSASEEAVSDVIPGHAVQARDAAPLPAQSNQIVFVICVLSEEERDRKRPSRHPVKLSLISNHWVDTRLCTNFACLIS